MKITVATVNKIDARDLTNFLTEKMGRKVEYGDTPNDTDYDCAGITGDMSDYEDEDIEDFESSGYINFYYPGPSLALNYAVSKGWLEPGDYLVSVCW